MNARRRLRVLLAIGGVLVLAGCSDDAGPSTGPDAEVEPRTGPDYVLLLDDDSDPDQMAGEAGAYAMTARGHETPPLAVVDVPAGFSNFGFFAMWPAGAAEEDDPFQAVQYWTVHGVHRDPCERSGAAPEIGGSVEDLAEALVAQRRTTASTPEPVTLGGHEGLYLELTVPVHRSFRSCSLGAYVFWEGKPNDAHHVATPRSSERLWILDVDGIRVVLAAITGAGTTDAQAAALTEIVRSVRFDQPA